ncbi:MAG: hypothetical protein AUH19_01525 [Verrucomicrobia bacterium 13_2_20CM_55_10]|nr:MAG: hypothetical protein AUH19_01525 [Verrucomicrobia bacterium 13_2_20CM_55_10]PYI63041.1 MAG: hypothetical protein DMF07_11730 [Verrucomicrobiota bacterium]
MEWKDLAQVSLALALLIALPLLSAWIFRWAWKRWRSESKPRRLFVYNVSLAAWFSVLALTMFILLSSCNRQEAPPTSGAPPANTMPAFPWPPPAASAETMIPDRWLSTGGGADLSNVAVILESALRAAKYPKWSYSSVPNGFALVSQMEQIKEDGTPSPEAARWSTDLPAVANMTLMEFVRALVNAQPGYYRVIVFIVTNQPWSRTGTKPTGVKADKWLAEGFYLATEVHW